MKKIINFLVPIGAAVIAAVITLAFNGGWPMAVAFAAAASIVAALIIGVLSTNKNDWLKNSAPGGAVGLTAIAVAVGLGTTGVTGGLGGTFRFGDNANIIVEGSVNDMSISGGVQNMYVDNIGSLTADVIQEAKVNTIESMTAEVIKKLDATTIEKMDAQTIKQMTVDLIEKMDVQTITEMNVSQVDNLNIEHADNVKIDYVDDLYIEEVKNAVINNVQELIIGGEKVDPGTSKPDDNNSGNSGNSGDEKPNTSQPGDEKPNTGTDIDGNKKPGSDDLDGDKKHQHDWSDEWSSNSTYHWKECSGCDEIKSKAKHTPKTTTVKATTEKDGYELVECKICGYEISRKIISKLDDDDDKATGKMVATYDVPKGNYTYGNTYTIGVVIKGATIKNAPKNLKFASETKGVKIEEFGRYDTAAGLKVVYNVTFPATGNTGYFKFNASGTNVSPQGECVLYIEV